MKIESHIVLKECWPVLSDAINRQADRLKSQGGHQADLGELLLHLRPLVKAIIYAYYDVIENGIETEVNPN